MTPADLRAWQARMGISAREAARRLGVAAGTYQDWVTGTSRTTKKPIALPPLLPLACAALEAGLQPVGHQSRSSPSMLLTHTSV